MSANAILDGLVIVVVKMKMNVQVALTNVTHSMGLVSTTMGRMNANVTTDLC